MINKHFTLCRREEEVNNSSRLKQCLEGGCHRTVTAQSPHSHRTVTAHTGTMSETRSWCRDLIKFECW